MKNSFTLRPYHTLLIFGTMLLIVSRCNPPAEKKAAFDLSAAKTEIEGMNKTFTDLVAKSDSAGVADIYTEDAKLLGSHAPAIVGKKNIGMAIGSLIKAGITQVGLKTIEVWGTDEILTEEGELSLATRDGKQIEKGKYVVIWKKADGHWKILRDFSNSDLPLPSGK